MDEITRPYLIHHSGLSTDLGLYVVTLRFGDNRSAQERYVRTLSRMVPLAGLADVCTDDQTIILFSYVPLDTAAIDHVWNLGSELT